MSDYKQPDQNIDLDFSKRNTNLILELLKNNRNIDLKGLQSLSKLTESDFNNSIWSIAREGKLAFYDYNDNIFISLL